jgi:hypothetical protein
MSTTSKPRGWFTVLLVTLAGLVGITFADDLKPAAEHVATEVAQAYAKATTTAPATTPPTTSPPTATSTRTPPADTKTPPADTKTPSSDLTISGTVPVPGTVPQQVAIAEQLFRALAELRASRDRTQDRGEKKLLQASIDRLRGRLVDVLTGIPSASVPGDLRPFHRICHCHTPIEPQKTSSTTKP